MESGKERLGKEVERLEIKIISLTDEAINRRDYRDSMEIHIDGERVFSVFDGEPEDANLARDFNDCWTIPSLLEMAHKAGIAGKELSVVHEKVDEL